MPGVNTGTQATQQVNARKWLFSGKGIFFLFLFLALVRPVYGLIFSQKASFFLLNVNLSVIAIVPVAFEFGFIPAYIISGSVSVVTIVSMFFNKGSELPYLASILFINLIPLVPAYYNGMYNEYFKKRNSLFNESRESYEEFTTELKVLKDLNISLQNQVHDILDLYEVTKKMSASLEMDEMLRIFREAISKISKFVTAKVILIDESQEAPIARITYEIHNPSTKKPLSAGVHSGPPVKFDQILAESISSRKEVIYLKSPIDRDHPFREYLGDGDRSFIALPLLSEGIPIGILTIEGIDEEHAESFSILAEQLSLELKKISLYERVQSLAITDGLTGIYVRRHFLERYAEDFARSKRHNLKLSVLMIDLDHFKQCNDAYGHLVGDIVLKEIAKIMKDFVRQVDLIGRYGGEEFVLALPDTDRNSAIAVAERIRQEVERHKFKAYDETIAMTISAGVATYPDNGDDVQVLIDKADQALYRAKEEGRNRVVSWP
ncbi:MAG: sensor domain-containing diguanylate cyclase [Candidatus Omnitrophica bacterium]|nr:sensor domain-containing diguanylate cyclase [Candidatus Omnitrophota bacterium]MDD5738215.1 sensor domain-containing diguanylate cyclase [Candidatus Omnitrophota bacterium]